MRTIKAVICAAAALMLTAHTSAARDESYPPLPEALAALDSDNGVTVTCGTLQGRMENPCYYCFEPSDRQPAAGFILYPGGKVDARSYAPTARNIAAGGYLVVVVCMPNDLAHLGYKRAAAIVRSRPEIETWAIGGHSMGGSFACLYARRHPNQIDGVVLWASWPSALFRLDRRNIGAISIYGSKDGFPEYIENGARHLPPDTEFVRIEGGNHTQFGYYDTAPEAVQEHDHPADISRKEQQEQIVEATVDFLDQL